MLMILIALSALASDPDTAEAIPESFEDMETRVDDAIAQLEELALRLETADAADEEPAAEDGETGDTDEPAEDPEDTDTPEVDED